MHEDIMSVYSRRAEQYRSAREKYAKQISIVSAARLLLFVAFAWLMVEAFRNGYNGMYLSWSLLSISFFLACVYWAASLKKKNTFLLQLLLINENEKAIYHGQSSFLDRGMEYMPPKGFTVDLNVFGAHSLFHLLNRAGSVSGKQQLAAHLLEPFTETTDILQYQSCIQELSAKIDFRQTLLAHALLFEEEESLSQLQAGIPETNFSFLQTAVWKFLAVVWPVGGMFVTVYSLWKNSYSLMLAYIIVGLLLLTFILKKINLLYYHISKRSYLYSQYAKCFQLITRQTFLSPYLRQKQQEIMHAEKAFQKLSRLIGLFDLRLSMLSFVVNGLFLSDLLCAGMYLRWNRQYQGQLKNWFTTLGEMELLNSLSTFDYNHPSFIFPVPIFEELKITATGLGHPLMDNTMAVVNDFSIGEPAKLHLITGSNMSGKSTFLRTLGLNLLLAQLGAPVFAKTFVFRPVRLLTSFHHIDSLEERTSYFYAELKCLKGIIESLAEPVPALVLLDEVMRGTNSKDKHDGTALLIQKILHYHCLALIATHDTELGSLSNTYPGIVANFCFESDLSDDGLTFDFTMRAGVAQTKNATYLMKKMGII